MFDDDNELIDLNPLLTGDSIFDTWLLTEEVGDEADFEDQGEDAIDYELLEYTEYDEEYPND